MLLVKTSLGLSDIEGIGLFAEEFIPKGTVVWKFHSGFDLEYSRKQINKLPEPARKQVYRYSWLDEKTGKYLLCGDDARHFNHSDDPNTDNSSTNTVTTASRDIQNGEEITCDYSQFDGDYRRKIVARFNSVR